MVIDGYTNSVGCFHFVVVCPGNVVRVMNKNDFFGEGCLIMEDQERGATVNALTRGGLVTMLTLTRESFRELTKSKVITAKVVATLKARQLKWQSEDEARKNNASGAPPPPPQMSGLKEEESEEEEEAHQI